MHLHRCFIVFITLAGLFFLNAAWCHAAPSKDESIAFIDNAVKKSSLATTIELGRQIKPRYDREFPDQPFGAILSKNDQLIGIIEKYLKMKKRKVSREALLGLREIANQYRGATPSIRRLYDAQDNPALLARLKLEDKSICDFIDKHAKALQVKGKGNLLTEFQKEPYSVSDDRKLSAIAALSTYEQSANSLVLYLSQDKSARDLITRARKNLRWGSAETQIAYLLLKHEKVISVSQAASIEEAAEKLIDFQLNYAILIGFAIAFIFVAATKIIQNC
ncbi:hypothetical protein LJB99_00040 [Deltaproteobacteria bacterium OttesenSCG-928-K17]|nr:hypothetical protein [Deltaproteobacteria bacterium OttesenSCG-928-K17]